MDANEGEIGGAWDIAVIMRAGELAFGETFNITNAPSIAGECELPCETDVCTNGACIAGMVLQQSCPSCP